MSRNVRELLARVKALFRRVDALRGSYIVRLSTFAAAGGLLFALLTGLLLFYRLTYRHRKLAGAVEEFYPAFLYPSFYCGGGTGHVYCVALGRAPRRTVQYVSGALGRAPCIHARLHRLATNLGEKCGLAKRLYGPPPVSRGGSTSARGTRSSCWEPPLRRWRNGSCGRFGHCGRPIISGGNW